MSRYDYMNLLESSNSVNVNVYDPTSLDFSDFPWKNGWQEYRVTPVDIRKFYKVSEKFYNTADYEDVILIINNVADPFLLTPGVVIYIPDLTELKSYLLTKLK